MAKHERSNSTKSKRSQIPNGKDGRFPEPRELYAQSKFITSMNSEVLKEIEDNLFKPGSKEFIVFLHHFGAKGFLANIKIPRIEMFLSYASIDAHAALHQYRTDRATEEAKRRDLKKYLINSKRDMGRFHKSLCDSIEKKYQRALKAFPELIEEVQDESPKKPQIREICLKRA